MDFNVLLDAPTEPTRRVQIAKLGSYSDARYGDFSITEDNVASWQRNLGKLPGGEALIDFEHRSVRSPRDSKAAGWITDIGLDGDAVMADVRWTPPGEQAIKDGIYRFMSPTYGEHKTETGEVFDDTLVSAALTNVPFLGSMPAVSLATEERVSEAIDADPALRFHHRAIDGEYGEHTRALVTLDIPAKERKQAAADGNALQDGSYPIRNAAELHSAAVLAASGHGDVAAAKKLIRKRAGELGVSLSHLPGFRSPSTDSRRSMEADTLIKTLELEDGADDAKILEALEALKAKAEKPAESETKTLEQQAADDGKVLLDSAKYAELAQGAATAKRLDEQIRAERFETAFTRALDDGKAVPAQKEQLAKFYALDAESTLKMLQDAPVIMNVKPQGETYSLDGEDVPETVGGHRVLGAAHVADQKVKAKLKELGKPMTDYAVVLDQLVQAGEL